MSDPATLPADMLAPTGGIERAFEQARAGMARADKKEQAAYSEADKAIEAEKSEIGKQRKAVQDFSADHPFPHPDVKPWTEKPPENKPLESFGSWASAFGIIAGAVTRTGLASSLNASAAAMQAFRQGDLAKYDEAHQAWKDNMDVSLKQADWEARGYENALELFKTDQNLGLSQVKLIADQAQNKVTAAAAEKGDIKTIYDMYAELTRVGMEGAKLKQQVSLIADTNRRILQLNDEWKKANPGQQMPPDVALQHRVQAMRESQVSKPLTANYAAKLEDRVTNYETVFDDIDFVRNNLGTLSVGLGGKVGRPLEDLGEILKLTDESTRNRITGALERIKQAIPNLKTGTTRQLTDGENRRLELIVGGQYTGSTVTNTAALLTDLENNLLPGYNTTRSELAGNYGGGGGAADSGPSEGDTATNPETGEKLVFQGGQWVAPTKAK